MSSNAGTRPYFTGIPNRRGTHRTKTEEVLEDLRERIVTGQIKRDAPLTMNAVAEEFGYSITPVREAFRILQAEGLLPYQAHHATKPAEIMDFTVQQVRDIYALRALVEGEATRLATEKLAADPLLATQTLRTLHSIQDEMETANKRGDKEEVTAANTRWHATLYGLCGNTYLIDTIHRLWNLYPRHAITDIEGRAEASIAQHCDILEAITMHDSDQAKTLMEHHLLSVRASIEKSLEDQGARQS